MSDIKKTITFQIVTPERVVFEAQILQVSIPTENGEITVLPEHLPLVSILKPGVLELKLENNETEVLAVSGGFLEIVKDKVVILADTAEMAHDLNEEKIEEARKAAENIKIEATDDKDFANALGLIEKQLARSKAMKRWRKIKGMDL